jgi:hypothetical protein
MIIYDKKWKLSIINGMRYHLKNRFPTGDHFVWLINRNTHLIGTPNYYLCIV